MLNNHRSTNHHLRHCRNKPSDWEHVSGKGTSDKRQLSDSMGDGPSWIPLTKALQEAIGLVAPSDGICDITEMTMNAFFEKTQVGPPFSWSVSWNGISTVEMPFIFFFIRLQMPPMCERVHR
jgi:hypothetical protein